MFPCKLSLGELALLGDQRLFHGMASVESCVIEASSDSAKTHIQSMILRQIFHYVRGGRELVDEGSPSDKPVMVLCSLSRLITKLVVLDHPTIAKTFQEGGESWLANRKSLDDFDLRFALTNEFYNQLFSLSLTEEGRPK